MATTGERTARRPAGRSTPRGDRGRGRRTPRERQVRRPSRRVAYRRRWIAALVVLALAGATYVVLFTPLLGVRSVEVHGARTLSAGEIREVAAVPRGVPLARLDTGAIAERVSSLPAIAAVDVSRSLPSTVEISVTERTPLGFHDTGEELFLVDVEGVAYKKVARPPKGLPKLDLPRVGPGDRTTRAVTRVLTSLPEPLRDRVVSVRARTPGSVEFTLRGGKIVRWGSASDAEQKAKVLAVLLTRKGNVYDVTSPELPTVS